MDIDSARLPLDAIEVLLIPGVLPQELRDELALPSGYDEKCTALNSVMTVLSAAELTTTGGVDYLKSLTPDQLRVVLDGDREAQAHLERLDSDQVGQAGPYGADVSGLSQSDEPLAGPITVTEERIDPAAG